MAGGGIVLFAVEEVVVVRELFARANVARGENPDFALYFIRLTIWIAGVIDERGDTVAVNHAIAVTYGEKIGDVAMLIELVAFFLGDARPGILDDLRTLLNRSSGENASGVNIGRANDNTHIAAAPLQNALRVEIIMDQFSLRSRVRSYVSG